VSVLFPVFFTAKAGHEEDLLLRTFPGYREYRSRVPHRLVPWLL
jgi:protein-S-isoprenylcysteine O-methyltransferase Ste14